MKKKFTFILITFLFSQLALAQTDSSKINMWVPSMVLGLNISQIAFSNWTQGGDNAITWTFITIGGLNYPGTNWSLKNNFKLAYGRTKLGNNDFRTNDNEFYLESVLSKNVEWVVEPYFSNTIRTAISQGYSYDSIPPYEIASFFDPGYITQSLGFIYNKQKNFNTRLGIALQEVFTKNHTQYSDDETTTKIEKFKLETGIESVTNAEFNVAENLLAKSSLRLFSRFNSLNVWDVRWDNVIAAKVNSFLNVNLTFLLIYEKKQSVKTQIKQALQLGFSYTLL